ncbi:tetratricopeptide repeat protein 38-like [Amphiura filiformis]|uniref:tetratricopeptide repeat protein 38-like n=1 Tax=Amphiura filiformis TaxID=82378 RepID=UPI003B219106
MHCQWRDCKEWLDSGLPLSTTSNEAVKMYDAVVTQYVSWCDNDSVGGMEKSVETMMAADPQFVMGSALANGLDLMATGQSIYTSADFKKRVDDMVKLATTSDISQRERKHVDAVKLFADGDMLGAGNKWEDILLDHPTDMLALRFAHDSYFYRAMGPQMRDSVARVLPHWKPTTPLYGYVLGMHSFGLIETNFYDQAEKVAKKGLELNQKDAWSTHTICHVLEMEGRQMEGINFLKGTESDWASCNYLAAHNYWHWALYHTERAEYESALGILDDIISRGKASGALIDMVDACSLIYRLEMEGVKTGDRWNDMYEMCRPHTSDHILVFNDVHILLSCLGAKKKEATIKMMESMKQFVSEKVGTQNDIAKEVGIQLCAAFIAADEGDYAKAVDLVHPLRYKIVTIGGSNAQRDLFNLFLIHAALNSPKKEHHCLARSLLAERKAFKENAPMTDRLMAKALALHQS